MTVKSFFLVADGEVTTASHDTEYDGETSVLVYAQSDREAKMLARLYDSGLMSIGNIDHYSGTVACLSDQDITARSLISLVATIGRVEFSSGVYLDTRDNLLAEKDEWVHGDPAKHIDFSTSPYWITTDSGDMPIAIDNEADMDEFLAKMRDE